MKDRSTVKVVNIKGIPVLQPNSVVNESDKVIELDGKTYNGFYISYNNYDTKIYGDVTTALVLGQMQKFYILNGDHRKQYEEIIEQGFLKCLEYFKNNISQASKYSDEV